MLSISTQQQYSSTGPQQQHRAGMEHFCCDCCNDLRPLVALLDLDCHCSICTTCCEERLRPCMVPLKAAAGPAAAEYAVGDVVRYAPRLLTNISNHLLHGDQHI